MDDVGLPLTVVLANDPFFGRARPHARGRPARPDRSSSSWSCRSHRRRSRPRACRFNYHQDHFGHLFGITPPTAQSAHTACIGFGLERIALALFKKHGMTPSSWPASVRGRCSSCEWPRGSGMAPGIPGPGELEDGWHVFGCAIWLRRRTSGTGCTAKTALARDELLRRSVARDHPRHGA